MRRSKIIATIGPATDNVEKIEELLRAGVNVARLNFSHGDQGRHAATIEKIREASQATGIPVAILIDTKGPEIRTKNVPTVGIELTTGQAVRLCPDTNGASPVDGAQGQGQAAGACPDDLVSDDLVSDEGGQVTIAISYPDLARNVRSGDRILLDDGLISLQVREISGVDVICLVQNAGRIFTNKSVNIPGVKIDLPSITAKDESDIRFAIDHEVEFIAASFVREAKDLDPIRAILDEHKSPILVISKIENNAAVENIDEIIEVSDGIMVARGDLGVEIPAEQVPLVQKQIIKKCNLKGKPVVTATQMLDSMERNPRPTRAEASDVANAIIDGSDAIMLSGETAIGRYPIEAVQTMSQIALATEEANIYTPHIDPVESGDKIINTITSSLSHAVATVSAELSARAIVTATSSGYTARMIAKYRPMTQIIAITPHTYIQRQLLLYWGINPIIGNNVTTTDEMFDEAVEVASGLADICKGDIIIITAGVPVGQSGTTNLMKIHIINEEEKFCKIK